MAKSDQVSFLGPCLECPTLFNQPELQPYTAIHLPALVRNHLHQLPITIMKQLTQATCKVNRFISPMTLPIQVQIGLPQWFRCLRAVPPDRCTYQNKCSPHKPANRERQRGQGPTVLLKGTLDMDSPLRTFHLAQLLKACRSLLCPCPAARLTYKFLEGM